MTVLDTSGAIDFLIGGSAADQVRQLLQADPAVAAPDLLVFETVAVLRRLTLRKVIRSERAQGAVADLSDLPIELFPAMQLRQRAFELRANLSAADAFFVALAELLDEPLATKDRSLATAARRQAGIDVIDLV